MRRTVSTLALSALLAVSLAAPLAASPSGADTSPVLDFQATALDGSSFDGRSLAGKPVLLDFWGTWCAPCIHAFPKLKRLHAEFGERLEVVGLAFYSGEPDELAAFAAKHELDYTILSGHDETIAKFQIFAFPSYVLISADGQILFQQAGEMSDLYERVAAHLAEPAALTTP